MTKLISDPRSFPHWLDDGSKLKYVGARVIYYHPVSHSVTFLSLNFTLLKLSVSQLIISKHNYVLFNMSIQQQLKWLQFLVWIWRNVLLYMYVHYFFFHASFHYSRYRVSLENLVHIPSMLLEVSLHGKDHACFSLK